MTSQKDRVKSLRENVIIWMNSLEDDEALVVGIPRVLGPWDERSPVVVFQGMQEQFLSWLDENQEYIHGPTYNLPPLKAGYVCAVIDKDYDPRIDDISGYGDEVRGVLDSLGKFLDQCEELAHSQQ